MTDPPAGGARESPGGARAYHRATKHSSASVRRDRHALDWANKPFLFKVYPDAPAVPLPREVSPPTLPVLEAVARGAVSPGQGVVDTAALAQLLFFSAGLTKRKVYPGGETFHFRAAASTGALYQTEVYVVAGAVAGLEPGVYHFCPGDFTLRRLRAGDHRAVLAEAAGRGDLVAEAPATAILTAIHWRNTWKYRARAFRHFFWDAGTLLANLLATAVAIDVRARVLMGFADPLVNALLGIDAAREGSLVLVPLGRGAGSVPPSPPVPPLALSVVPLSPREEDHPLVRAAYEASALPDGAAARAWLAHAGASHPVAVEPGLDGSPGCSGARALPGARRDDSPPGIDPEVPAGVDRQRTARRDPGRGPPPAPAGSHPDRCPRRDLPPGPRRRGTRIGRLPVGSRYAGAAALEARQVPSRGR